MHAEGKQIREAFGVRPACRRFRGPRLFYRARMYEIKSARSCGWKAFSNPSGMRDKPELVSVFKSPRKRTSSLPPGLRRVMLEGVSDVMMPLISRSFFVTAV